ncbi:SDR family NAD(P)-dependent oxidoreductase [Pseudoalteromonas mariniglutinosa]|uniref:SDR family NAD(P)-dependent oxidoreductase n=1 Tax=Pseudoalteromonas mariniglutinosa TaxID=206042 RepID=UPI00384E3646
MQKTWFITGASRGIGLKIVQAVLASGDNVIAAARNTKQLQQQLKQYDQHIEYVTLDVQDEIQVQAAVSKAINRFNRIDILVNNAGFGQLGYFENLTHADIEQQFATNVFGLMHVTRVVLPIMRQQKSGHIFNLSSIGGVKGFAGATIYCASKFAVEGFSESLAPEVTRFGIGITIVEPGFFRTDFLDSSSVRYSNNCLQDYIAVENAQKSQYDSYNHTQLGDPKKLAQLIVDTANADTKPLRLVAGSDALALSREMLASRMQELDASADAAISTDHSKQ